MARLVVLDSGPLWLAVLPRGKPPADACRAWLKALEANGAVIAVPEIADYEVRRELLLRGAGASLRRLDAFKAAALYLPITTDAMTLAARYWAALRKAGNPTSAPGELDGDAVLAAQAAVAARPGDAVTVATTNVGHLGRFPGLDARPWSTVT